MLRRFCYPHLRIIPKTDIIGGGKRKIIYDKMNNMISLDHALSYSLSALKNFLNLKF